MPEAKRNWATFSAKLLLSLLWLLFLLEVTPRLLLSTNLFARPSVRHLLLGDDDSSWRLFWIVLHRMHSEWTGEYAHYDPARGWAVVPNIRNMRPFGKDKVLNTNSKGLRGTAEHEYASLPGEERIVCIGDSFTFGTEVSDDETYPDYLQADLPQTDVLNLGVSGYGHDQALLYLQQEGAKYHPKVVILGFVWGDTYRNLWKFWAFAKPRYELTPNGLKLTNVPVPSPEQVVAEEPYRSKALDVLVILREKIRWLLGINDRKARTLTAAILDQIVGTSKQAGAVPVIVYLPAYHELDDTNTGMSSREQFLQNYCDERHVDCLFLRPRFRQEAASGARLESEAHWNAAMHKIAAEEIARFLVAKGLANGK